MDSYPAGGTSVVRAAAAKTNGIKRDTMISNTLLEVSNSGRLTRMKYATAKKNPVAATKEK